MVVFIKYSVFLSLDISWYFLVCWPAWCDIVARRYQFSTSLMKLSRFRKWNLETGMKFIGCSFWRKKCMCDSQHCSYLQKKEVSTFSIDLEWYQTDGDRMHVREAPFWTVLVLYLGEKSAPKHPGKPFYPLGKHGKKVLQTVLAGLYAPPPFRAMLNRSYGNNTFQKGASLNMELKRASSTVCNRKHFISR